MSNGKIAVIRVRGVTGIRKEIKDTLEMLRLHRKNYCVVIENIPTNLGMLKKVKDYVTYGEIDEETYKELVAKRAEDYNGRVTDSTGKIKYNKFREVEGKKIKPYFRLSPPRKGFGKSIKQPFVKGGALGYRKEMINELIKRML